MWNFSSVTKGKQAIRDAFRGMPPLQSAIEFSAPAPIGSS